MFQIAKKETGISGNLQLLLIVAAVILFYFLLKPLLNIFLGSIILTYIFYPLYKRIKNPLKYEALSISITLILIILIFLMPFVFVASQIPSQAKNIYDYVKENIIEEGYFDLNCENKNNLKCNIINFIMGSGYVKFDELIDGAFKKITSAATNIVIKIPNIVAAIGLALFISYFLFKDGKKILKNVTKMIPLNRRYSNRLIDKFGSITYSVVFAHIIVAIVQGAVGAVGFYLFGIESAIFWGVIMAILALLPFIGSALVWAPASLFLVINGIIINSYWDIGKGIGLLLYGILIISTIDNVLRAKIVGGRSDVHPLTVLIGIIGGINMFGLIGIFVGPIVLALLINLFKDLSARYS